MSLRYFLIIPNIEVFDANAISSSFTVGFPAMTTWLGFAEALKWNLRQNSKFPKDINFIGCAPVCHDFKLQVINEKFKSYPALKKNPLKKDGKAASFQPAAYCHFKVTVVIETDNFPNFDKELKEELLSLINHILKTKMRLAGGIIASFDEIYHVAIDSSEENEIEQFLKTLSPGHVLISREELLSDDTYEDSLDALLSYLKINTRCVDEFEPDNPQKKYKWESYKKEAGWLVPMPVGFIQIGETQDSIKNQRNPKWPHAFAEAIITLCEFKVPTRLKTLDELMWFYDYNEKKKIYRCSQVRN